MTRIRLLRTIFVAALVASATACTMGYAPRENWGELPSVPAGMANIHFLRPASLAGSAAWPELLLNDQRVGILPSSTFTVVTVRPGAYKVSMENGQGIASDWAAKTDIEVAPDRRYFLLLEAITDPVRDTASAWPAFMTLTPRNSFVIKSVRWIHLDEVEGTDQARLLLYSPAPRP